MAQSLTPDQVASALSEEIYRRSQNDQAITVGTNADIVGTDVRLVDSSNNVLTPPMLTKVDNYYYDDATGFVGRVVNVDGIIYVVFRGTDMSGGIASYIASELGFNRTNSIDTHDYDNANFPLGTGNTQGTLINSPQVQPDGSITIDPVTYAGPVVTQLDDALALAQAAKQVAGNAPIMVVGQSLGGGLAGLVSVILNIPSFLFDPAPFENELTVLATELAFAQNNVPLIDPLTGVDSGKARLGDRPRLA